MADIANAVTGNVTLRGSTSVQGANSIGAALLGDINGALKIQGNMGLAMKLQEFQKQGMQAKL